MAKTMSAAALSLALILMASGTALARPVTQVQAVAQRALLQQPACQACLPAKLTCSTGMVLCLPGQEVDVREKAGCKLDEPTDGQTPLCRTPSTKDPVQCPAHGSITSTKVCENAISLVAGQKCDSTCVDISLVAVCDLDGKSARSTATCAKPVVECNEGDIVDISQFSCTSTNSYADTSKDSFYFPLNKALSLTASKVKCPPKGTSCKYLVGALSSNTCKAANVAQMAEVTVGSGSTPAGVCESPY